MSKRIVILGSARSDGNTRKAVEMALGDSLEIIDLNRLNIQSFDYEQKSLDDDFIPLIKKILDYDQIILATPVYWYTMSGLMKSFIDRWSDLLISHKDLGRALAGKKVYIVTSFGSSAPPSFEEPIALTCKYLNMDYCGCFYFDSKKEAKEINKKNAEEFRALLQE